MHKKTSLLVAVAIFLTILITTYTIVNGFDINNIEEYENKKIRGLVVFVIIWFVFLILCIKFRKVHDEEGFYYREIPCNGDLYYIYSLIEIYNINYEDDPYNIDLINAKILEWYFKGIIDINGKSIEIKDKSKLNNDLDKDLLIIIEKSRNFNLSKEEKKELAKKFLEWMLEVENYKRNIYTTIDKHTKKEDIRKIKGLRNYLKEYSYISEKNVKDVKIWEEYLVIANLLGISKEIEKDIGQYILQNDVQLNLSIINELVKYLFNII
jgi:hypothetical protein